MSRTVFYCRCGQRIEGASERFDHARRCDDKRAMPDKPTGTADADGPVPNNETLTNSGLVSHHREGIDWMTLPELSEAIPPAYTEHIGLQLMDRIASECAA